MGIVASSFNRCRMHRYCEYPARIFSWSYDLWQNVRTKLAVTKYQILFFKYYEDKSEGFS